MIRLNSACIYSIETLLALSIIGIRKPVKINKLHSIRLVSITASNEYSRKVLPDLIKMGYVYHDRFNHTLELLTSVEELSVLDIMDICGIETFCRSRKQISGLLLPICQDANKLIETKLSDILARIPDDYKRQVRSIAGSE